MRHTRRPAVVVSPSVRPGSGTDRGAVVEGRSPIKLGVGCLLPQPLARWVPCRIQRGAMVAVPIELSQASATRPACRPHNQTWLTTVEVMWRRVIASRVDMNVRVCRRKTSRMSLMSAATSHSLDRPSVSRERGSIAEPPLFSSVTLDDNPVCARPLRYVASATWDVPARRRTRAPRPRTAEGHHSGSRQSAGQGHEAVWNTAGRPVRAASRVSATTSRTSLRWDQRSSSHTTATANPAATSWA